MTEIFDTSNSYAQAANLRNAAAEIETGKNIYANANTVLAGAGTSKTATSCMASLHDVIATLSSIQNQVNDFADAIQSAADSLHQETIEKRAAEEREAASHFTERSITDGEESSGGEAS